MEPQGRKKDLTVSCDETKHETTSPEQDHSITSARSNSWAERRDKNVSAPSRRRRMSLDIPFYRTCPVCANQDLCLFAADVGQKGADLDRGKFKTVSTCGHRGRPQPVAPRRGTSFPATSRCGIP